MKTVYPLELSTSQGVNTMYDLNGSVHKSFSFPTKPKLICRQSLTEGEIVYLESPGIKKFCKILWMTEWEGNKYTYEIELIKDNLDLIEAEAKQKNLI